MDLEIQINFNQIPIGLIKKQDESIGGIPIVAKNLIKMTPLVLKKFRIWVDLIKTFDGFCYFLDGVCQF